MQCSACGTENPAGTKFCGECGAKLEQRCGQCGEVLAPGVKFCGECGTPVAGKAPAPPKPVASAAPAAPASPPATVRAAPAASPAAAPSAPDGERKQVSVVCCSLAGAAELAPRLGAEQMHALLSRFFELARQQVERYEGRVSQFLSNGFVALFGVPIAHEDHARRATLAVVELEARAREIAAGGPGNDVEIRLQIGIDTGLVVVGGGDMVVGEPMARAELLRAASPPGGILLSGAAARQVEGQVEIEAVSPIAVPQSDAPLEAFRVVGLATNFAYRAQFDPTGVSPFVGRQRELASLEGVFRQASSGAGQVVGLAGEAGSGKSRLLFQFRRQVNEPVIYLLGHCQPYASGIPFFPLLTMIRRASGLQPTDPPDVVAEKLRTSLEQVGSSPEESLPIFLWLLGIEKGTESLADLEPQALQSRAFNAMRRMIFRASQRATVIIELEDLHWLDRTSEAFIASLVEGLAAARVLLIATYRLGYLPSWLERSYATQITLPRLSGSEARELVTSVLRRAHLPEELSERIAQKAEGNPLFLEELARSVADAGAGGSAQDPAVPDTLQGLLMARLDRLPETQKRLLQTASVVGREFSLGLLQAIWDRPSEPLEPPIEELKKAEFIYGSPTEDEVYFFKHALIHDVAYHSLLTARRQALHKTAAEWLERGHGEHLDDVYDLLVYHYPRAGESAKTVHYLLLFAQKAVGGYAHAEAATALEEALEHAGRLPVGERDRTILTIVLRLASSLLPLARFPASLELLAAHQKRAVDLGDPSISGPFEFWLAHTHSYMGNQEAAAECAQRAIAAAQAAADEATEGRAWYVLGREAFWAGRFKAGLEQSQRAIVLLERSGDPWWQGQAHWVAGFHHFFLGQFEPALEALSRAYRIGEALDDYRLDSSWSVGYLFACLGDWEKGIEHCMAGLARSRDPLNSATATGFLGYALLEKGDLETAMVRLADSVAQLEKAGMLQLYGWFAAYLAEAEARAGRAAEAAELGERGLAATRASKFQFGAALALRALGLAALAAGDLDAAAARLGEAREAFQQLSVPFEEGRVLLELANLATRRGEAAVARAELTRARELFSQLKVDRFVERVDRRLAEVVA